MPKSIPPNEQKELITLCREILNKRFKSKSDILLSVTRSALILQEIPSHLSEIEGAIRGLKKAGVTREHTWQLSRLRNHSRSIGAKVKKLRYDTVLLSSIISIALGAESDREAESKHRKATLD